MKAPVTWTLAAALCFAAIQSVLSAPVAAAGEGSYPLTTVSQLDDLARQGQFEDVLSTLREGTDEDRPAIATSLIEDLQRFQTNAKRREAERLASYSRALSQTQTQLAQGDLDEAMISAIEAHSLAEDPDALLEHTAVAALTQRIQAKAKQAETDEDWVEATALYSRLNLLYQDDLRFREDVKRVARHVRLLHLYAPAELERLQARRAKRLGEEDFEARDRPIEETWQVRLRGITPQMVRDAIRQVAQTHIDHPGYASLVRGTIEPLIALLETPAMADTFAGLEDPPQVEAFRNELEEMIVALEGRERPLKQFAAVSRIDEVLLANQRTVQLPEEVVSYEMTEGALATLDEFSSMYWPQDIDMLSRSTQGQFSGIGIQITRRVDEAAAIKALEGAAAPEAQPGLDGAIVVVSPLANTPARAAGLKAGDVIRMVDGQEASAWSLAKAVREITGPVNTPVKLGIERAGHEELLEFSIVRKPIKIESVKGWHHNAAGGWDYWLDKHAGVGYVRLTSFVPQTETDLDRAVDKLRQEGVLNSLILDLRHNPGGLLTSAIEIVNRFLADGPILYTVNGEGRVTSAWNAKRRGTYPDFNLIVLINQGSASASEIVAGALQDRGRAFVVGHRSFGKGSVQDVSWFPNFRSKKWGLKVTTQHYQLPGGRIIHRTPESPTWGVQPDLNIDVTNQTIAWRLELRQELDVLRDENRETIEVEKSRPWVKLAGFEPVDPEAETAHETVEVPIPDAEDLLELGLDPQLEAALLLAKTRAVAETRALAQAK